MANKYLSRDDAPFEGSLWGKIDDVMLNTAKSILSGRKLLPVEGPFGLSLKSIPLADKAISDDLSISSVLPVLHLYRQFSIGTRDLAAYDKNPVGLDLSPVAKAAVWCAEFEDRLIFQGTKEMPGILTAKGTHEVKLADWNQPGSAADDIIRAITILDDSGFHGPYTLALSPARFNLLYRRYPQGNTTELDHLRTIVTGGIIKSPAIEKGGVLLAPAPHFAKIILGQDMTVGFVGPADGNIDMSISESLAVQILEPKTIAVLKEK